MQALDSAIIDYLFQPIINRWLLHPLDMSLPCAIGTAVMMITAILFNLFTGSAFTRPLIVTLSLVGIVLQYFSLMLYQSNLSRLRTLIQPGHRNPLRLLLLNLRLVTLGAMTMLMCIMANLLTVTNPLTLFFFLGCFLWIAKYYFEACDCPPPHRPLPTYNKHRFA